MKLIAAILLTATAVVSAAPTKRAVCVAFLCHTFSVEFLIRATKVNSDSALLIKVDGWDSVEKRAVCLYHILSICLIAYRLFTRSIATTLC